MDIQRRLLPQTREVIEEANEYLKKKTEVSIRQTQPDSTSIASNSTNGGRSLRRTEPPNNDVGYLICTILSKLNEYGIVR